MRHVCCFDRFGRAVGVLRRLPTAVARHPLREAERASHTQRAPGGGRRDRRQKAEQFHQPLALLNLQAQAQGQGHCLGIERRYEPGPSFAPERTVHEGAQPPLAPALQGPAINPQRFAQPPHPFGLQAVRHRRNQDDDQARIHASAQETHRGRSVSSPAAFFAAAQTETHLPLRATPRLPFVIAPVELARTMAAALKTRLLDQIAIDFFQELI